jgi:hypothetical protein
MNVQYGVAVWVLLALGLLAVMGKIFASVNLSVGK